jgi:hypothetical protein
MLQNRCTGLLRSRLAANNVRGSRTAAEVAEIGSRRQQFDVGTGNSALITVFIRAPTYTGTCAPTRKSATPTPATRATRRTVYRVADRLQWRRHAGVPPPRRKGTVSTFQRLAWRSAGRGPGDLGRPCVLPHESCGPLLLRAVSNTIEGAPGLLRRCRAALRRVTPIRPSPGAGADKHQIESVAAAAAVARTESGLWGRMCAHRIE